MHSCILWIKSHLFKKNSI